MRIALHVLLVAVLCSLHHWASIIATEGHYTPFSVSPSVSALTFDETHAYAPPARRFMSLGKLNAEVDEYERRNLSAGIPFIPAAILGTIGRLTGSLDRAFILSDVLFPACLFLVLYWTSGTLIQHSALRLLIAWSSILIPFGLKDALWIGDDALIAPLEVTRTPQPEITFLVLMIAVACTGRAVAEKARNWRWTLAAGIFSGAVVYCYYFYAVAWGISLGLLLLFAVVRGSRSAVLKIAAVISSMVVLALPFALATLRGQQQEGQSYLLDRMGAHTHRPDLMPLLGGFLITFALWKWGREVWQSAPVYSALILLIAGSLYGMNIQVLTGYETQRWHFWKRLALPVCFFVAASATAWIFENRSAANGRRFKILAHILLAVLILNAAAREICAGVRVSPYQRSTNPEIALLRWADHHTPRETVIGTVDPELILLIPALTTDYTYVPSGLRSLTSTREIVDRYVSLGCLLEISPETIEQDASVPNHLGSSTKMLQVLGLSYNGDRKVLDWLMGEYRTGARNCGSPAGRLDYIILPAEKPVPGTVTRFFPAAHVVHRNRGYELLALGPRVAN